MRKFQDVPKIYVAGKLNDNAVGYLKNVSFMMEYAEHLRERGFSVFVPAIDLLMGIKFNYQSYENYFNNSQPWLTVSDAMFLCPGWENSSGTAKELELASKLGIPAFTDVESMKKHFNL